MRNLLTVKRARPVPGTPLDHDGGAFTMFNDAGETLRIIATSGDGWDHISVSLARRCPTWAELELVKRTFFKDDETAMQLHVPPDEHVNNHEFCLHLWRPLDQPIPRPPAIMVGIPGRTHAETEALKRGVF